MIDDDPTGTQTVKNVPVWTVWDRESLESAFLDEYPLFFILSNTRALTETKARKLTSEICTNIKTAAEKTGSSFSIISRSDSTLRGHFPAEPEAIEEGLGHPFDAWLIIPFFAEGGRITENDIHYLQQGSIRIPVSETSFAKDPVFGFRNSKLKDWIEEKTGATIRAQEVLSISVRELEESSDQVLLNKVMTYANRRVVIVNATNISQLRKLAGVIVQASSAGKNFLYRTASSWVKVLLEQATDQIEEDVLISNYILFKGGNNIRHRNDSGGLIVVGSYVPETTAQLNYLLKASARIETMEIKVADIPVNSTNIGFAGYFAKKIDALLVANKTVVIYTSRENISGDTPEENLNISCRISAAISEIVGQLGVKPAWLIAKGGITSSDIATRSLGIKKAIVVGSLLSGIPVWQTGPESKFPGMLYIVFPGNVGTEEALYLAVEKLSME